MITFNHILQESTFPTTWSFEEFEKLRSFAARKRYCDTLLKRLGSGSGRIAYDVDSQYVLKLAKNPKGVAQNEVEVDFIHDGAVGYFKDCFSEIEGADPKHMWIIAEYCRKVNPSTFKQKIGVDFNSFCDAITYLDYRANSQRPVFYYSHPSKPDCYESLVEDCKLYQALEFAVSNYDMPLGDYKRLSSYGINREGNVVIVDYGLNKDVAHTYYGYEE